MTGANPIGFENEGDLDSRSAISSFPTSYAPTRSPRASLFSPSPVAQRGRAGPPPAYVPSTAPSAPPTARRRR
eukprot:4750983-Prymnesium_polylepis.1